MLVSGSFWLTLLQICVLAALVYLGSASVQQHTCPAPLSIPADELCPLNGSKHRTAREQLSQTLDRSTGTWNKKHPRWQLLEALHGYDSYEKVVGAEIDRFESLYKHVPRRHKSILDSTIKYRNNFNQARQLLKTNAVFCNRVFHFALAYYNISRHELATFIHDTDDGKPNPAIRTTISQTLKHMVRDWSSEGHAERGATFSYILSTLTTHLPPPGNNDDTKYSILVPGAGLGRLAYEVSLLGPYMSVTSNEWSASMNMAYRYLTSPHAVNHGSFTIHPFLETWSHATTRDELTRPVIIQPPHSATADNTLLVEGDFTTRFQHEQGQYDAIVTLFFIDTARNLVAYLETIQSLLKPGGVWINVGPLLYGTAPLVQLSLEEIVIVAEAMGFEFEITEGGNLGGKVEQREVLYNFNQSTLYKHGYVAQCWVAKKRKSGEEGKGMLGSLMKKWI